jgi:cell division protein FtsN
MSQTPNAQRGGTLIGIFVGLVLGVVVAASVVWYLNRSHSPFQNKDNSLSPPAKGKAGAPGSPESLPAKPGDKQQRFDFYNILPGGQDTAAPAPKAPPPEAAVDAPDISERYYLQAGAFQKKDDAENLKGQLALIGIEAYVTEVTIPEKGKMHRVRSGPYNKAEEMNRVRTQMSQGGIQATVVKIKDKE